MTDRSEERNAGRQEMSDCLSAGMQYYCWSPMAGLIVCQWVAFGWHPRILGRSWREGMASRLQTDIHTYIHAYSHTDRHTYIHGYIRTFLQTYLHANSRSRDKLQTSLGAMEIACNAMEIAAKQTLCDARRLASRPVEASLEAGLETGLEAMEIAIGCYGNCSKGERLG